MQAESESYREAVETRDRRKRSQLAAEIQLLVTRAGPAVTDALPANWVEAMDSSEYLQRIYRATQAAIRLQQWHAQHWTYPADASVLPLSLDRYGLRYESSEGAKGYKIVVEQGQKAGTVLFEQQSFGSPRPQVH